MSEVKVNVPFNSSPELKEKLLNVIKTHKDEKGALIPILQEAQGIYGYLPIEVQKIIAKELNIPLEKIYGVVTFYSFFNLYPKGENKITVCLGTACYVKGAQQVLEKIEEILSIKPGQCTPDGKFSLDSCRCLGACGLGPVMLINDDVYGKMTPEKVEAILDKYR